MIDRLRDHGRLTAIDRRESLIAAVQGWRGRSWLFAIALLALAFPYARHPANFPPQLIVSLGAAFAYAYFARSRSAVLFFGTWLIAFSMERTVAGFASLSVFLLFAWASLRYTRRFKEHFYARRPVLSLLGGVVVLYVVASNMPAGPWRDAAWAAALCFKGYIWFLAYAILDQRSRERSPDIVQLGVQHPFWGSSNVPFGKGAAFLRKHWSKDARELAITQLKGLKLLLWADALLVMRKALGWLLILLAVPDTGQAISAHLSGAPFPVAMGWTSIVAATTDAALDVAIWGHSIIGLARLAGFRLPRNTRAPLQARSIADFWNRYYFYLKELLVDFFYVPTFLRMFRHSPRLRLFFATFMAAGVGNAIYHFVRALRLVEAEGLWRPLETYTSYFAYCVVLAIAVAVSQLRVAAGKKPTASAFGRIRSFVAVWSFVVCLQVFSDESRVHSLVDRVSFMASLFGVQ